MTTKQTGAIHRRVAWMLGRFTEDEMAKCRNVTETSLSIRDGSALLSNLINIETWRPLDSEEFLAQWVKNAKQIIERIA